MADVYAAGDVANHLHPLFGRIRVEHYNDAEKQGTAAGRSMLGSTAPYDHVHTFWSDQYEHTSSTSATSRSGTSSWSAAAWRSELVGFYLVDGVVRAAIGLDRGGDPELDRDSEMAYSARLVAARARPACGVLADEHGTCGRWPTRRWRTGGCSRRWPGPAGCRAARRSAPPHRRGSGRDAGPG